MITLVGELLSYKIGGFTVYALMFLIPFLWSIFNVVRR